MKVKAKHLRALLRESALRQRSLKECGCGCGACSREDEGDPYGVGAYIYDLIMAGEDDLADESPG